MPWGIFKRFRKTIGHNPGNCRIRVWQHEELVEGVMKATGTRTAHVGRLNVKEDSENGRRFGACSFDGISVDTVVGNIIADRLVWSPKRAGPGHANCLMLADLRFAISRVEVRDLEATFRFSYKWESASTAPTDRRRRLGSILQDMLAPPLASLVTPLFALSALPALAFPSVNGP